MHARSRESTAKATTVATEKSLIEEKSTGDINPQQYRSSLLPALNGEFMYLEANLLHLR